MIQESYQNHSQISQVRALASKIMTFFEIGKKSANPALLIFQASSQLQIQQNKSPQHNMKENSIYILKSQDISENPIVEYNRLTKQFAHLYLNYNLETARFKQEINLFLKRKESFSGNVVTIHKIRDERIAFNQGNPAMQINVVTDYVPWRLHLLNRAITYEEALFLLDGCFKGFRELLHRVRFPFMVQDFMIGIDINGNVRVWWSKDFYKNRFPFTLTSQVKLKDMVMSLVRLITSRMNQRESQVLEQNLLATEEITFLTLQHKIQMMSNGLKLKVIGMNMLNQMPEVTKVLTFVKQLTTPLIQRTPYHSRIISIQPVRSQQRIIISNSRSPIENEASRGRLISKRTYKEGFSPNNNQKMRIIKNDIQSLRQSAYSQRNVKLRASKSVNNLYSFSRGIKGNPEIPQVHKAIHESQIIANDQMTVSRFIEPSKSFLLTMNGNPQNINTCSGVSILRKSEIVESMAPLELSRIRSLQNLASERQIFSTERSNNQSKIGTSYIKNKFGQSEKKLPQSQYFTKLFEG